MSPRRRLAHPENLALVFVGLLIFAVALIAPRPDEGEEAGFHPTTFSSGKSGLRALQLAAERLGIETAQWMLPLAEESGKLPPALAIVAPRDPLTPGEAKRLAGWVEGGGRLCYVPRSGWPGEKTRDALLEELGVGLERRGRRVPFHFGSLPPGAVDREAEDEEPGVEAGTGSGPERRRPVVPWSDRPGGTAISARARDLLVGSPERLRAAGARFELGESERGRRDALLLDEEGKAVAALLEVGTGRVFLLADSAPLHNARLGKWGYAALALRALGDLAEGGKIWFEEFHHGFDERGGIEKSIGRFLGETETGWGVAQLAAVGLLALVCAGVRLGRPIEEAPPRRRSSLEHVTALAALYRGARARARPASLLLEGLRWKLGSPTSDELKQKLAAAAAREGGLREAVAEILRLLDAPGERAKCDLVLLSESIDRVLEALGAGQGASGGKSS